MSALGKTLRTVAVGVLLTAVFSLAVTVARPTAAADAQVTTDFVLSVSTGTIPPSGTSSEVIISIDPGQSAIAAIGATVTIDSALVEVSECVALVGLGVCNTQTPGVVNVQTVDPSGWTAPTELFRLTFLSDALTTDAELEVLVIEAFALDGSQVVGGTADGTLNLALNGDVDCDNIRTVGDALIIAQFVVGLRTANTCPLPDPTTQIDLTYADATGDGLLDVGDALQVARCTVGLLDCDE